MREIVTYIQLEFGIPLCTQAARCGLGYNTLRRWASGDSEPSGQRAAQYLTWALGAVCDPLFYDSCAGVAASIPRGYRVYSAVTGDAGAWRWLLVVCDGRVFYRSQVGCSSVATLGELRDQLVSIVSSWCLPADAALRPAPRSGSSASSRDRRYWSAQSALQAAQIRVLLAQGLAARGDLTEDEQDAALSELRRALAEFAEAGAHLRGGEAG